MVLTLILRLIYMYKSSNEDQLKSIHNEVRSFIPLFKKGSSETETILFNFKVPIGYVVSVYSSMFYVFSVAVAIFWQTAFIEEVECSPLNSKRFCYINSSKQIESCDEIEISQGYVSCYHFTVRFGEAIANAAGIFTFYIVVFGLVTYIILKFYDGKNGTKLKKVLIIAVLFTLVPILYGGLIFGVSVSNLSNYQIWIDTNYLIFILFVFINVISLPLFGFKKLDRKGSEAQTDLDRADKSPVRNLKCDMPSNS